MTDTSVPTTTPTPSPAPTPTPDAPDTTWMDSLDDVQKGYVANKGWHKHDLKTAFGKVLDSYRGAETKIGIEPDRVLRMPNDQSTQAEVDEFYAKLGRPAKAEEYTFDGADDSNRPFADKVRDFAFKEGLSKAKGEKLWKSLIDHNASVSQTAEEGRKAALTNEQTELEKNWGKGAEFQAKKLVALRAAQSYGITEQEFDDAASKPGFSAAWNLLLHFGKRMGDDKFIPGGVPEGRGGLYTREQALAEMKLYKDPNSDKCKLMKANNPETWANYRALAKIAYPEEERQAA